MEQYIKQQTLGFGGSMHGKYTQDSLSHQKYNQSLRHQTHQSVGETVGKIMQTIHMFSTFAHH